MKKKINARTLTLISLIGALICAVFASILCILHTGGITTKNENTVQTEILAQEHVTKSTDTSGPKFYFPTTVTVGQSVQFTIGLNTSFKITGLPESDYTSQFSTYDGMHGSSTGANNAIYNFKIESTYQQKFMIVVTANDITLSQEVTIVGYSVPTTSDKPVFTFPDTVTVGTKAYITVGVGTNVTIGLDDSYYEMTYYANNGPHGNSALATANYYYFTLLKAGVGHFNVAAEKSGTVSLYQQVLVKGDVDSLNSSISSTSVKAGSTVTMNIFTAKYGCNCSISLYSFNGGGGVEKVGSLSRDSSNNYALTLKGVKAGTFNISLSVVISNHSSTPISVNSVTLTVTKGKPTVSDVKADGQGIAGNYLSTVDIAGTASTSGTLAWTTPKTILTEGSASYGWTFTPIDTDSYEVVRGTATVVAVSPLDSIEVSGAKTNYKAYESFTTTGMTVTAKSGAKSKVVTNYTYTLPYSSDDRDYFLVKDSGSNVTISYTEGNTTVTTTVKITVSKADISLTLAYGTVTYGMTASPTLTGNTGSGTVTYSVEAGTGSATINSGTGLLTPTAVGTVTVTVTVEATTNYNGGTTSETINIVARNIANATVGVIENYHYDGTAKTPKPTVKIGETVLVEGTDYKLDYDNNVAIGTAKIIITGLGNYVGTKETTFAIETPTLADATVTISQNEFTYDGTAKEPKVTLVKIGELTLAEGVDFTVKYSANVNAGTAKVILTGTGAYVGEKIVEFTINPANISGVTLNGLQIQYTYTGSAIVPPVTAELDGKTLVVNVDYLISYENNLNAGTAVITVTGYGNYTGEATRTFTILSADISSATVTEIAETYEYTGKEVAPLPTVNWNSLLLENNTDYTLDYTANVGLGKVTVTITGTGNFTGETTVSFEIVRADISSATVDGIDAAYKYTGSAIEPPVTVTYNGVVLANTDFEVVFADNVNKGTATVTITGIGNYTGTITRSFTIGEANIDDVKVTGIAGSYEYTGEEIAPEVEVTFNGIVLAEGKDYSVAFADNKERGTATVTITGLGNFTGERTITFEIVEADISKADIDGIEKTYEYTGSAIEPEFTVTLNGKELEKGVDYTVTYRDNVEVGENTVAIVVVKGMGNYAGTLQAPFTIVKADISKAEIELEKEAYPWTGVGITPAPKVTLNGVELVKDRDFAVNYGENTEVGGGTFTVIGINNYTGSVECTFEIIKATPEVEPNVDWDGEEPLFVGNDLPTITATAIYNGKTVEGTITWDTEEDGFKPSLKEGECEYGWTFTPKDTEHYEVVRGSATLTAKLPTYIAIEVEWKDGVQPELFTSSSVFVIKQNLKVMGVFDNGEKVEIAGGFTFVGSWDASGAATTTQMPTKGGDKFTVTVTFGNLRPVPIDGYVVIQDVVLTGINVDDSNAKTDYTALDAFDTSSIVVTATYNDGTEKVLAFGEYGVEYEHGESLSFGDEKVTVTFTDGVTKTGEVTGLTVAKKKFEGTLALNPEDKDYNFGSTLTGGVIENLPDWVKVTYIYEDEEGNTYTGGVTNAGIYKVTAKFEVDDNHEGIADITATFTINKIDPVLTPAVGGSLTAGMKLSDLTFSSGNGATAGTLTWDDAAYELKEGVNRCYYTFTPEDGKNFNVLHGYVDIAAETAQIAPVVSGNGNLAGWHIALIVICIALALIALIALVLALKLRRAPIDTDGFNDPVTEDDLKMF